MTKDVRNTIPEPIKRKVRQRCGFGCVICGHPIYEIDHIVEWSVVKEHRTDNLTLLCSNHHMEKTKGLLPIEAVIKADSNPFNIKMGQSSPYSLKLTGNKVTFFMGDTKFISEGKEGETLHFTPILLGRMPIFNFKIENGNFYFSSIVFDELNRIVLIINQNELIMNVNNWDIENKGNKFIIRESKGKIILNMRFLVPDTIYIDSAILNYNGQKIVVKNNIININDDQITLSNSTFINNRIGIRIG